jgi:hypothetical protein
MDGLKESLRVKEKLEKSTKTNIGKKTKQRIIIYEGDKYESKNFNTELKEIEKINKGRAAAGLSLLKIKLVKCLRCNKKIYTVGRYRCLICQNHIEKFNIYEGYG